MGIEDIGIFQALKTQMSWLNQRQKVVAQNVANASTPGFKPKDLKPLDFAALVKGDKSNADNVKMALTSPDHMAMPDQNTGEFKQVQTADSETTLDGNSVVLEEEMVKMSESRVQFEAAMGFYEKSLNLLQMAEKAPGK